jgi:hypothetical protein
MSCQLEPPCKCIRPGRSSSHHLHADMSMPSQRPAHQATPHHSSSLTMSSTSPAAGLCCRPCCARGKQQARAPNTSASRLDTMRTESINCSCSGGACSPAHLLLASWHACMHALALGTHEHLQHVHPHLRAPPPSLAGASVAFVLVSSTPWSSRAFLDGCSPGAMPLVTLPAYTDGELIELVTRVVGARDPTCCVASLVCCCGARLAC